MTDSAKGLVKSSIPSENDFRELLVNRIADMFTIISTILYPLAIIRGWNSGWTYLELIYSILFIFIVIVSFLRKRITTRIKVVCITLVSLVIAIMGFCSMGMLAGAVFYFSLAGVIFALFFSKRTVVLFEILLTLFLVLVAIGFSSNLLEVKSGANTLLSSYTHWILYILSFSLTLTIICITILNYRKELKLLIENLSHQRKELEQKNIELNKALDEIRTLRGILPLCSYCKKIREDEGYWEQVDVYIHKNTDANISHSICPDCMEKYFPNGGSGTKTNNNPK